MKPIDAHGMLRMDDGSIANIKDFHRFESSDLFDGLHVEIQLKAGELLAIEGWRLTSDGLPTPLEQQQLVTLRDDFGRIIAEKTVQSLLSIPGIRERDKSEEKLARAVEFGDRQILHVLLRERPVEGCGLRVHLYGLRRHAIQ